MKKNSDDATVADKKFNLLIGYVAMLAQIVNSFALLEEVQTRNSGAEMG